MANSSITPFRSEISTKNFIIPPTIITDYQNWLNTDVPNYNLDWHIWHDWYDQFAEVPEEIRCRAEYYPINWKSKIGNTDMNQNFATDFTTDIRKGDLVIRDDDGRICMLNWEVQHEINRQVTQAITCNHFITVTRHVEAQADSRGFKIKDAGEEIIVNHLPCVCSEYAGRPDYQSANNTPGIHADMLMSVNMQYNSKTSNINIGDRFEWSKYTYVVVNLNYAELDINLTHGILNLNGKRVAGDDI